jgi:NAD(P)-dependent dehydrogenase (short-subunit alcohol dehydrogenase family)
MRKFGAYGKWKAYPRSKLALILFTLELRRRLSDTGIVAVALNPGGVMTPMFKDHMLGGSAAFTFFRPLYALFMKVST